MKNLKIISIFILSFIILSFCSTAKSLEENLLDFFDIKTELEQAKHELDYITNKYENYLKYRTELERSINIDKLNLELQEDAESNPIKINVLKLRICEREKEFKLSEFFLNKIKLNLEKADSKFNKLSRAKYKKLPTLNINCESSGPTLSLGKKPKKFFE